MGIKFSIKITNDSGEEKPFEEYREEKKERIHKIISKLEELRDELDDLISAVRFLNKKQAHLRVNLKWA